MMNKKKLYCSIALNYDHFTDDEMEEKEIERGRKEITIIPLSKNSTLHDAKLFKVNCSSKTRCPDFVWQRNVKGC